MLHAFKIGPLDTGKGATSVFFAVGDEGVFGPLEATDDAAGFRLVKAETRAELRLAPEHASIAEQLGLKTLAPPAEVTAMRAMLALQFFWHSDIAGEQTLLITRFVEAAVALHKTAPWEHFADSDPLTVSVTGPGPKPVEAAIVDFENERGLALHLDAGAVKKIAATPLDEEPVVTNVITVLLSEEHAWVADALEPLTGSRVVPELVILEGEQQIAPRAAHLKVLTAAMDAVNQLSASDDDDSGTGKCEGVTVTISIPDPSAPVKAPVAVVGRNDLCPCGSGKKFKKCHMGADA